MRDKRITFSIITVVIVMFASVAFGFYHSNQKKVYASYMSNDYQRSFYEIADSVSHIELMLEKAQLTNDVTQNSLLFAELWKQADSAKENLSNLPYNQQSIANTLMYLTQVSDFSYYCLNKAVHEEELTEGDHKTIKEIRKYSAQLSNELNIILDDVNNGSAIDWNKIAAQSTETFDHTKSIPGEALTGSFISVTQTFKEYASLIYDGPFAEHIYNSKPKMTQNLSQISAQAGIEAVKKFLNDNTNTNTIDTVELIGQTAENANVTIPTYTYQVTFTDRNEPTLCIDISQKGGLPVWMLDYDEVYEFGDFVSPEDAKEIAKKFLDDNSYENMKPSYYECNNDMVIVNFAPEKDGVIYYADLIKVKVSLVDGDIIGFESLGYLSMHHDRPAVEAKITEETARQKIVSGFQIIKTAKALIPLSSKKEVLCYEFTGKLNDNDYIVYVNALNGNIEKIWKLLISETGILTE